MGKKTAAVVAAVAAAAAAAALTANAPKKNPKGTGGKPAQRGSNRSNSTVWFEGDGSDCGE